MVTVLTALAGAVQNSNEKTKQAYDKGQHLDDIIRHSSNPTAEATKVDSNLPYH